MRSAVERRLFQLKSGKNFFRNGKACFFEGSGRLHRGLHAIVPWIVFSALL